jgi:hypothetical protein
MFLCQLRSRKTQAAQVSKSPRDSRTKQPENSSVVATFDSPSLDWLLYSRSTSPLFSTEMFRA